MSEVLPDATTLNGKRYLVSDENVTHKLSKPVLTSSTVCLKRLQERWASLKLPLLVLPLKMYQV